MIKSDLNKYKKILEARANALDQAIRRRDAIIIENSAEAVESMLRAREREFAVRTLESETAKLRETRAALQRIQEDAYGICQECEAPINPRRLEALPWAALCIRCQEANDCHCGATNVRPLLALAA